MSGELVEELVGLYGEPKRAVITAALACLEQQPAWELETPDNQRIYLAWVIGLPQSDAPPCMFC